MNSKDVVEKAGFRHFDVPVRSVIDTPRHSAKVRKCVDTACRMPICRKEWYRTLVLPEVNELMSS